MESLKFARMQLRELLAIHYMEGTPLGDEAEQCLLRWGGWIPDPQQLYGDGTPWTQPADQGMRHAQIRRGPSKRRNGYLT